MGVAERLGGPPAEPMGHLMNQALEAADPKVQSAFEPDEAAYLAATEATDSSGNAAWRANVLDHGWRVCKMLYLGEPDVAARLAHSDPVKAATTIEAAKAHLCPQ